MEEAIFYIGAGDPADKQSMESYGHITSIHGGKQYQAFRQADCSKNGAFSTGVGIGEKVFVASATKAVVNVYSYGKEGIDQRMPVPEPLSCLTVISGHNRRSVRSKPSYRVPWLLVGGTKTGKLYVWELLSGDLILVKEVHYQAITAVKASACGTFLVTASEDSRSLVFKTIDLVSTEHENVKPWWSIADHSLAITDVHVSSGLPHDLELITVSKDSTARVYNILTQRLINTYILPCGVESVACDPANRAFYAGLSDGTIRIVSRFRISPDMNLERAGKYSEIVTLKADPEFKETVSIDTSAVLCLGVSLDGTNLISGDASGNIYIIDVSSKQLVRSFKLPSAISHIQSMVFPQDVTAQQIDKNKRLLPALKRVLTDSNQMQHELFVELAAPVALDPQPFEQWLDTKAQEELQFRGTASVVATTADEKLTKVALAYNELKARYDQLLADHQKLI